MFTELDTDATADRVPRRDLNSNGYFSGKGTTRKDMDRADLTSVAGDPAGDELCHKVPA